MRWGAVKYLLMGFALAGVGFAVGAKWQGNGLGAADVFNQTVVNPAAPHEATLTVAKNDASLSLNPREGAESATPSSANVAPAASAQLTVLFSPRRSDSAYLDWNDQQRTAQYSGAGVPAHR